MKLKLIRTFNKKKENNGGYCIGHLYVDGQYWCDTIEDLDRGLNSNMSVKQIDSIKVYTKTSIPIGTYKVTLDVVSGTFIKKDYYKKFCGGKLPRLINVPGYAGILMHRGVNEDSSAGCLILGYNKEVGKVVDSQKAFEGLYKKLKASKDGISIEICRKYSV